MIEYAHDNTKAIDKFARLVVNHDSYEIVPDVGLSECEFCGVHGISGLGYIDDIQESVENYTELEIRKKNDSGYDYSYFVCLNCAVYFSNKENELKNLIDAISNNYEKGGHN